MHIHPFAIPGCLNLDVRQIRVRIRDYSFLTGLLQDYLHQFINIGLTHFSRISRVHDEVKEWM
jgi:hypothetical protein